MCTHIKSLCSDIRLVSIINLDWVKESRWPLNERCKNYGVIKSMQGTRFRRHKVWSKEMDFYLIKAASRTDFLVFADVRTLNLILTP